MEGADLPVGNRCAPARGVARGVRQERRGIRPHIVVLAAWTLLWFLFVRRHGGISWHYLRTGGELLFGAAPGGGLAIYANHPELQIGPVSFLAAAVFAPCHPTWRRCWRRR